MCGAAWGVGMLKHRISPYKMWYLLGYDYQEMCEFFDIEPQSGRFCGKTIYSEHHGWIGVVLNPDEIHSGPQMISVLSHELLHVVSYVGDLVGFWPGRACDMEPWTYLQENLMEVSLEWLGYE